MSGAEGRRPIAVSTPDLADEELDRVVQAVKSTWISATGEFLDEFETVFGRACGVEHVIPVSNGTVALHVALEALGVGPGDEVIVPSLTYIATANAVTYTGAVPVFVDVSSATWCLDPDAVRAAITPRTVAVIAVHLYGHPADMDALREITDRHALALVEDAAEAPFASYKGRPVGSLGDVAAFSFYGNKIISCGEGGAVTTNDARLAERVRLLRGQGMDPQRRYFFPIVGYNYRLTNVAAAILCGQLHRLDGILERRRLVFDTYDLLLGSSEAWTLQPVASWANRAHWLYGVALKDAPGRDALAEGLARAGVETRPFFVPIHTLPPYAQHLHRDLPVTDGLGAAGLSLPTSSVMSPDDVERVATALLSLAG